jgi:hypothetical protein
VEKLFDGLRHQRAQGLPLPVRVLLDPAHQRLGELDREHLGRLGDLDSPPLSGAFHVSAGLALGDPKASSKLPNRLRPAQAASQ